MFSDFRAIGNGETTIQKLKIRRHLKRTFRFHREITLEFHLA
jgi:hypothetical protein